MGDNKHAYWTTPTDQNNPSRARRLPAKHVIKYRNILYDGNVYSDNYTIINTNFITSIYTYHLNIFTTSIYTYHLNIFKPDTMCARFYFLFFISIVLL